MKRIKRVILSLLLSKNERVMLWNSLWFSNHTYRRRGNVDGAAAVQIVMNNLEHVLGVTKQKFTHEEVQKIVNDTIEEAVKKSGSIISKVAEEHFQKGLRAAEQMIADSAVDVEFNQGMIIDREECESCEEKRKCIVYKLVFGAEESGESKDTESSEKTEEQAPKSSEPVSEAERLRAEDDGVNYEKESSDIK
jgi:hypothetical protein